MELCTRADVCHELIYMALLLGSGGVASEWLSSFVLGDRVNNHKFTTL
jgi:hypothetical protein